MTNIKKENSNVSESLLNIEKNEFYEKNINIIETQKDKPNLLLHSCCGPCSTAVIERLIDDYNITVFFYNPNITDVEEYKKRRQAQLKVIDAFNNSTKYNGTIKYMEGKYDPERYLDMVKGHEEDPEGGQRCSICFDLRLEETALMANMYKFDIFTTTLTVSPHKNYEIISSIGKKLSTKYNVLYLDGNFKKKDGFKRSIELSKEMDLYRQNYCGCQFSVWEK